MKNRPKFPRATKHKPSHLSEIEGTEDNHDETTCLICYMEFYGRMPIDLDRFKYGKERLK